MRQENQMCSYEVYVYPRTVIFHVQRHLSLWWFIIMYLYYVICIYYSIDSIVYVSIVYNILYTRIRSDGSKAKGKSSNYRIMSGASNQVRFSGVITNHFADTLINKYTIIYY